MGIPRTSAPRALPPVAGPAGPPRRVPAPGPAPGPEAPLARPGRPRGLWRHRALLVALVRRELATRFGTGRRALLFCLASPLALIALHAALGIGVLGSAWRAAGQGATGGPLAALALGVLVFSTFADVALAAPGLVPRVPGLVKRVAFPLETLVAARLLAGLAAAAPVALLLVAAAALAGTPAGRLAGLPAALAPALLATAAVAYLGAALGPFFRDSGRVAALGVHALHLLSPVVYPLAALPEAWRGPALANPLAVSIEAGRAALLGGPGPGPALLVGSTAAAALALGLARALFLRVEKGFADVV